MATTRVNLTIDTELLQRYRARAAAAGVSTSAFITMILDMADPNAEWLADSLVKARQAPQATMRAMLQLQDQIEKSDVLSVLRSAGIPVSDDVASTHPGRPAAPGNPAASARSEECTGRRGSRR